MVVSVFSRMAVFRRIHEKSIVLSFSMCNNLWRVLPLDIEVKRLYYEDRYFAGIRIPEKEIMPVLHYMNHRYHAGDFTGACSVSFDVMLMHIYEENICRVMHD